MMKQPRILIVRLSSIGDVLHATPVAKALKREIPDCHITWIVGNTASELLMDNPYIDEVRIWPREEFELAAKSRQFGRMRGLWREIAAFCKASKFDIALDVHGLFLTGAIAAATKAPLRIGMAGARELNRFFMTRQAPRPEHPHVIRRYLSVLQPLGIAAADTEMTLPISPGQKKFAGEFFRGAGLDMSKKILMVHFQTSWPSKNWSRQNFAALIDLLPEDIQPVLCGSRQDARAAFEIRSLCAKEPFDITGKTSLRQLAALLSGADLLLTGDTGALHIAVAVGAPTVSLWGPTPPERYGPLACGHTVIRGAAACAACHKTNCRLPARECMDSIRPERVAEAIRARLSRAPGRE